MHIFWDLETSPLPAEQLARVMPEFQAPGNIKDPAKIAAAIEEKRKSFIEDAALKAYTGQIVALTMAEDDQPPRMVIGDEQKLVTLAFMTLERAVAKNNDIYAWNGHGFDLPFLCQRAAVYGITAFKAFTVKSGSRYYWHPSFIDPKLVWANYSPDHTGTSLKTVAAMLGVGVKDGNGKDFAELLKTSPKEAEAYAINDVNLLRCIVQRMGL